MRFLLPLVLALLGLSIGGGAGYFLQKPHEQNCAGAECGAAADPASGESHSTTPPAPETPSEYVKLNNQFVIPDVQEGVVRALIVLSLNIEIGAGGTEKVYDAEPKLRDIFLQILFDHANVGGFRGTYTSADRMEDLRRALLEGARGVLGTDVRAVLVSDIVRQDQP